LQYKTEGKEKTIASVLSFGFLVRRSARRLKDTIEPERSQADSFFCLGNSFQKLASLEIILIHKYKIEEGKKSGRKIPANRFGGCGLSLGERNYILCLLTWRRFGIVSQILLI
jgi:hypothetical protein